MDHVGFNYTRIFFLLLLSSSPTADGGWSPILRHNENHILWF